jgi:cytochrome c556
MKRIVKAASFLAVSILALSSTASAQLKPEEMVKLRQGLMVAQKTQVGAMSAVAKGEAQMSDATVAQAQNLATIAKLVPIGFGAGSESAGTTKAKPEIWKDQDGFKKKAAAFQSETAKLAEVAKGKDAAAFKTQFAATTATCKACHDAYRKE